ERGLRRSRSDARAIDRPDAWLFVVALRRWRTHRWRRRLFLPLDSVREQSITPAPGENAVVLIAELKRLPRREREVTTCRYILGPDTTVPRHARSRHRARSCAFCVRCGPCNGTVQRGLPNRQPVRGRKPNCHP